MTMKKLVHLKSAIIGAQLASIAMRGNMLPADTAENMILQQMASNDLTRVDVDLSACGQDQLNRVEIRRLYGIKMVECLLIKAGDSSLMTDDELERIVRRGWKMAQVMVEEDQVGAQLSSLRQPAEGT